MTTFRVCTPDGGTVNFVHIADTERNADDALVIRAKRLAQAERYCDMWIRNHNQDVTLKIVECNDIGRPMRK